MAGQRLARSLAQLGLWAHQRLNWERLVSKLLQVVGTICLSALGLRYLAFLLAFSWRLLLDPRDCLRFLVAWLLCRLFPSMAACFLRVRKGISFSSLPRQSYNAGMGVTAHHHCHITWSRKQCPITCRIFLVSSMWQVPPTLKGKRLYRG